jgi:hypothetical protein
MADNRIRHLTGAGIIYHENLRRQRLAICFHMTKSAIRGNFSASEINPLLQQMIELAVTFSLYPLQERTCLTTVLALRNLTAK